MSSTTGYVDRSDRKISAHATLESTPQRPSAFIPATKAIPEAKPNLVPSSNYQREPSDNDLRRRNKGKAPPPPPISSGPPRPSSMVIDEPRADSPLAKSSPQRPQSSYHPQNGPDLVVAPTPTPTPPSPLINSSAKKKGRISSPQRTLDPVPLSPEKEDTSQDSKDRELSPDKDLALQTLDDVIQAAEETMGM